MAQRLSDFLKKNTEVLYNGFWEYYAPQEKELNKKGKIVVNHTGTLTTGQQLEMLLDALLDLYRKKSINVDDFEFNLIGLEYFPEQMKRLRPYDEILNKIIFTTPRLEKKKAVEMNLKADYLVNFTDPNLSAIYAKTYDYIACQKPILVIPGDNGLLDELITKNNLGKVLNTKEDIIEVLMNRDVKYQPKKENTSFFTRENQCRILSDLLHRL